MAEPDTGAIRYFVLGPVQVHDDSGSLKPVNADKPRLLLAELLLRPNKRVSKDELIEALWSGDQPASTNANLKTYVYQLRQLVNRPGEDSPIRSRRGGYEIVVAPGELDADAFTGLVAEGAVALKAGDRASGVRCLRAALELWRGDPGREVNGTSAAVEVEGLRQRRASAQEELAKALIADGQFLEAMDVLRELLAEDELRETAWELLIIAQRDAGRPAEAMASCKKACRVISEEMDVEPGESLRDLHSQLCKRAESGPVSARGPETIRTPTPTPTPTPESVPDAEPTREVPRTEVPQEALEPDTPRRSRRWPTTPFAARAAVITAVVALVIAGIVAVTRPSSPPPAPSAGLPPELRLDGIAPRRPVPTYPAGTSENPKLLFGLGSSAPDAAQQPLFHQAPVGMLTTWFDDPDEIATYEAWGRDLLPRYYAEGTALHLVVVPTFDEGVPVDTRFGPGCGQAYQLSPQFLVDMRRIAKSFRGDENGPAFYVSMFNGMEKVTCAQEGYDSDPATSNYYRALKERYLQVRQIFHQEAPNARVALNWDGWQTDGSTPESTARRTALIDQFSDALAVSDFQSFNAFQDEDNSEDVDRMVGKLGQYGPVMVTNFGPNEDETGARARSDLERVFEPGEISKLASQGLFAWSFWHHKYIDVTPETYTLARDVVNRYGLR